MAEARRCPQCGEELPDDAPQGVCPKCVLKQGMASGGASEEPAGGSPHGSGFVPPTPEDLAPDFPQFAIIELLGRGGMGAVYKARQLGLERMVALKIIRPEAADDPAFAERFAREARAMARLNHPNIVAVYDFGMAGGLYYLAMEYVDGANLRQVIAAGDLEPREALAMVSQVCDALQYAHDEGVVHRDIKPANILLDKRGRVKIADFGLAKMLGAGPTDFTLTMAGQAMGTPDYMAPEQREHAGTVDHRADIYSLGVVFYEMLTGELPLGRFAPPSKKVHVDVRLDEVVLHTLEREPERRYQHASEVKTEVDAISSGAAPAVAALGDAELVRQRLRLPAIGLIVAGALACLAVPLILGQIVIEWAAQGLSDGGAHASLGFSETTILACAALSGVLVIVGAAKMLRLKSYGLAVAAAILALLPCTLGFPVGLVMGIWALVVLRRPEVQAAFAGGRKHGEANGGIRESSIRAAGDGLIVVAGVALLVAAGVGLWLRLAAEGWDLSMEWPPSSRQSSLRFALAAMAAISALYALFIGAAGILMRRVRGRLYALLSAVIMGVFIPAVLALNVIMEYSNMGKEWMVLIPLWLGMPICIWLTTTLFRRDTRVMFENAARAEEKAPPDGDQGRVQDQPAADVKADAGAASEEPGPAKAPAARRLVLPPAIGVLLVGALAGVLGGSQFINWLVRTLGHQPTYGHPAWPLVAVAGGIVAVLGALSMLKMKSYGLAIAGSVGAMAAGGAFIDKLLTVAALPVGLWALVVLLSAKVQAAFGVQVEPHRLAAAQEPRRQVRGPAIALLAMGLLDCFCGAMFVWFHIPQAHPGREAWLWSYLDEEFALGVALCVLGVVLLVAALRMMRLRGYRLAFAGAILAMMPVPPLFLAGLPVGIWVLTALRRREVKAAFGAAPRSDKGRRTRTAWIVAGVIVGALVLLAAVPIVGGLVAGLLAGRPDVKPADELDLGGGVTMKLVVIPAGTFMMGSPDSEKGRVAHHEFPQHEVAISKPFYMGATEVTQAQYEAIMGTNPSHFKGETSPVENVSWNGATEFCRRLSEKTGRAVRLPTEAEWEYACRAGSKTKFCFGDAEEVHGDYAWSDANSGGTTHPVGRKESNAWGLYDMHGNVCEWCADWYGEYPNGPVTDPQGPASGTYRVSRGGCWLTAPSVDRSALRVLDPPSKRNDLYGFRVVVSVPGSSAAPATDEGPRVTLMIWGHGGPDGNNWERLLTKTGVEMDRFNRPSGSPTGDTKDGSLKFVAEGPTVVRLFETGPTADMYRAGPYDVHNSRLTYHAQLRTWALEGQAYLEMRCHFPGGEEFVYLSLDRPLSGTSDWTPVETSIVVKGAKAPDNVELNLVIGGEGTVWIDDVTLTVSPGPTP